MKPGTVGNLQSAAACVISDRFRFIYLTTAKNATTTLRAELTADGVGGRVAARASVEPELWRSYFTFAFLRDPIERLLAAYREVSLRTESGVLATRPFADQPEGMRRFRMFVEELERGGPWSEHVAPQADFFEGRRIDFWGAVESLQRDLGKIYGELGVGPPPNLPQPRRHTERFTHTADQLDEGLAERVRELYRDDYALIRSVRPDLLGVRSRQTSAPGSAVGLGITLSDGNTYSVELPDDHPALADLLALGNSHSDPATASIHQLPLEDGQTALTFSTTHLVGLEVRRRPRTTARREHKPGQAPSRPPHNVGPRKKGMGHDSWMNVGEGHLGGYMIASPKRVRGSATTPHGDDATWYPPLWRWLIEDLEVRSMIDIGCGEGHTAGFFRDAGCDVLGVDGSLLARGESVIPGAHVVHDFVEGPLVPDRTFDLAWSCEFVEHVEERVLHNFLATMAASKRYLLMTFAPPGQIGWHHVNCQRRDYWLDKLQRLGFELDDERTAHARKLAGQGHFRDRGLFLERKRGRRMQAIVRGGGGGRPEVAATDPLPLNPMPIATIGDQEFFLFHDLFVHPNDAKLVAVCSYYGKDWNPSEHGVDYDAVDLIFDDRRARGRCIRHRVDTWEPCMLLEFEHPDLAAAIADRDQLEVSVEVGPHRRDFQLSTKPQPAYDVAMSLVVRDENRWIQTFLEYYLTCLKASHIFVYDHQTQDKETLLEILAPYRRRGQVTYIPWSYRWRNRVDHKMTAQPAQEAHSLGRFANSRWLGFFDVDELLRLPQTTLPLFLERFADAQVDGLSFGIRWFSYKGEASFEEVDDAPLHYLHSRRDELGRKRQKFFVKGGSTRFLRLHWLEDGGWELPISDDDIYFHHYEQRPERFERGKLADAERDEYMLRFADQLSIAGTPPRPDSEAAWIEHLDTAIADAEREVSKLTDEVLALPGMCGRKTRHFYNNLCNFHGCRYLEIGSFHGASTCAAIYRNGVDAVCIDHWKQFNGRRGRFEDTVRRFRGRSHIDIHENDCFEIADRTTGPFDVYLYDGNHSEADQYRAVEKFVHALADYAVMVVDDWSRTEVRKGTLAAIEDLGLDIRYRREIRPAKKDTADRNRSVGAAGWWNGSLVVLVRRRSEPS